MILYKIFSSNRCGFGGYWGSTVVKRRHPVRSWLWEILKFSLISLQVFSMSFSYFFPGLFLLFGLWLGVARSPFLDEFKHWTFLYSNSRFEIISMRFLRHWGSAAGFGWSSSVIALDWSKNAATSGHDTCFLSKFLAELLFDFAGTFTGRSTRVRSF